MLGRILENWGDIIGPDLAKKAQPMKINYRKTEQGPSATLEIAVSSADATTLHYRKDLILERLNFILGDRHIQALKLVHSAVNANINSFKKPTPLTDEEKQRVSGWLENIEDDHLRSVLSRFGEALIKDKKN